MIKSNERAGIFILAPVISMHCNYIGGTVSVGEGEWRECSKAPVLCNREHL